MNKLRIELIIRVLISPFVEEQFQIEKNDCIENVAESYYNAWQTDIADTYRRGQCERKYEKSKKQLEEFIIQNLSINYVSVDNVMMMYQLFYPLNELTDYLKNRDQKVPLIAYNSIQGYYFKRLFDIAVSLLTFRNGKIAIRTWINEEIHGQKDIFDHHDAFDKVEIWNTLSRIMSPDIIIAAFFVASEITDRDYIYGQNGTISLADNSLYNIVSRGLAENHLHFNVGIEYSVLWRYVTNLYVWENYFNKKFDWLFQSDPVILFACVVYRYLYAQYMESSGGALCFDQYLQYSMPDMYESIQSLLCVLQKGERGRKLDEFKEFYSKLIQYVFNQAGKRESNDFLIDTVYWWAKELKTTSEMIFLVQNLEYQKKHLNLIEEKLLLQYIRVKNQYFKQFTQSNRMPGLDYFVRFFGNARLAENFLREKNNLIYREIFRCQAQNINIKKLEIRITPRFEVATRQGVAEYDEVSRKIKSNILKQIKSVLNEYKSYCISMLSDENSENQLSLLDELYENEKAGFPTIGIVYHFQKRDFLDNMIGDTCWVKYIKSGTIPAYSKHLLAWRKQSVNCARAIEELRCSIPYLAEYIVGIDAASVEANMEPWMLAPAYREIRNRKITRPGIISDDGVHHLIPNIGFTYHVGEEFRHVLSAFRHIDEVIEHFKYRAGDRLGHAIALGLDVDRWGRENEVVALPIMEYLENLLWLWGNLVQKKLTVSLQIEQLEGQIMMTAESIFGSCLGMTPYILHESYIEKFKDGHEDNFVKCDNVIKIDEANERNTEHFCNFYSKENDSIGELWSKEKILCTYYCPHYYLRFKKPIFVEVKQEELETYREIQRQMIKKIETAGIIVETNPTSNTAIGRIDGLFSHYIMKLNSGSLKPHDDSASVLVTINSDDPVVFNTNTENEMAYIYYSLVHEGYQKEKILEWMEKVRRYGMETSFIRKIKKPSQQIKEINEIIDSVDRYLKNVSTQIDDKSK